MTTSSRRRPSWDDWGLMLATAVSMRADCSRRRVGAVVITPDHTVVATGYNGAPPGQPGCLSDKACPRAESAVLPASSYDTGPGACISVHAEQNALLRASWQEQQSATLYITDEPCPGCWKLINASPLSRAVWPNDIWER